MTARARFDRAERANDPLLAEEDRQRKTRRNWGALIVGVFLVLMVVTNLPRATTLSAKQADFHAFVTQVHNDLLGCNTAITDAFDALQAVENHTAKSMKTANTILAQDQAECTIINSDLLDLAEANPPSTLIRLGVQRAINGYYAWAFPNADALIAYVTSLAHDTSNVKLKLDIRGRLVNMATQLNVANTRMTRIANSLGTSFTPLRLFHLAEVPNGLIRVN